MLVTVPMNFFAKVVDKCHGTLISPILLAVCSVNHRLPSGPVATPPGLLELVGTAYSVIAPPVVILAMLFPVSSVNQRLPLGPAAIPAG